MSPTNYIIATPDRRSQQRLCHVIMLKDFVQPPAEDPHPAPVCLTEPCNLVEETTEDSLGVVGDMPVSSVGALREMPAVRACLAEALDHLTGEQRRALLAMVERHPCVFKNTPGRTNVVVHDVVVGDSA